MNATRQNLALPTGAVVGPCRIEGEPSQWGFCLVYPARHEPSGRLVTLHELLPEELVTRDESGVVPVQAEAAEEFAWVREQFAQEGRRLGDYAGTSLQRLIAVLQENGTVYWVTAPDEPRTLKLWLQELGRAPTPPEFQPLFSKIVRAVEEAHAHRILHLNLKPETVQLTAEGEPLLAHFAVARQAIARRSHGAGMATAGYSALEQFDPEQTEDERTDLYALGAIGYRAVTGAPPPDAEGRQAGERCVNLAGRFPEWPPQFLAALEAALALPREERPASVAAWRRRMERPPLRDLLVKHPGLVLAGALALAVLLTVLVIWFAVKVHHPAHHAAREKSQEQSHLADSPRRESEPSSSSS